jgi:amino acid adenylation domain-containing protein
VKPFLEGVYWSPTAPLSCIHDLIARRATAIPDAVAVVVEGRTLSYAQLNANSNQLARFLRTRGVGPEVLVGLCLRRSAALLTAILGILKAGGAYVPLDPRDPAERRRFQLQDSGAKAVVTTDDLAGDLVAEETTVVRLDADWRDIARENTSNLEPSATLENPAYVIYTSGSTGKPKGVVVLHYGLSNYLTWAAKAYGKEAQRSALVHSSVAFDLTITGLFTPLLVGGRVELLPDDAGVEGVVGALRQPHIRGIVKITPAHLDLLSQQLRPQEAAGKVELFVIGGENLTAESLRFWREVSPGTRLINEYGPTETVVGCCVHEVGRHDPFTGSVPIGRAIDNTGLYILDKQRQPVGSGETGELYIGGAGVARGYLSRPELTLKHFLTDPFAKEAGARMYKTGDLARCREDGTLEYLGRIDHQVKIRDYRVELGEVEAVIAKHPAIRRCVVLAREDEPANKQLVGYAIRRDGQTLAPKELREFLRQKLPEYLVPSHYVFLDFFPLTSNGKVDRRALPPPEKGLSNREIVAPRNESESRLAALWTELLGFAPVSVTDNFFDLGGHSLLAARLLGRIEKAFARRLSMSTLFQAPTIGQLALMLEGPAPASSQVIPVQPAGSLPPFFCIGAGPLFRPLALRLGTDRPFLSLMPALLPEVNADSASCRLEHIATSLVNSILDHQKEGPYYIGGWSDSGVVAYETARQLMGRGYHVALLAMFDTPNPAFQQRVLKEAWLESKAKKVKFLAAEFIGLKPRNAPAYVAAKTRELRRKIHTAAIRMRHRNHLPLDGNLDKREQMFHMAVSSYQPAPYTGRLIFFKAAEGPSGDAWDFSRGWPDLVTGEFRVCEVPGDHRSMFMEPHVAALASNMKDNF